MTCAARVTATSVTRLQKTAEYRQYSLVTSDSYRPLLRGRGDGLVSLDVFDSPATGFRFPGAGPVSSSSFGDCSGRVAPLFSEGASRPTRSPVFPAPLPAATLPISG